MVSPLMVDVVQQSLDVCSADRLGPIPNLPAIVGLQDTCEMGGAAGCPFEPADKLGDGHARGRLHDDVHVIVRVANGEQDSAPLGRLVA